MLNASKNLGWLLLFWLVPPFAGAAEPVSFRNQIMPLLARGGCNQGACHGNLNGKGGFKLSLRGWDAATDHRTITHDSLGRRIDRQRPESSLFLLKAMGWVPHEGGARYRAESPELALLRAWIDQGCPDDSVSAPAVVGLEVGARQRFLVAPAVETSVRVQARFSNGQTKDVTGLAVFESSNPRIEPTRDGTLRSTILGEATLVVRFGEQQTTVQVAFVPARPEFRWTEPTPTHFIDRLVHARLQKLRMHPSEDCTDAEFLRRATIDALGILPTVQETRDFLADPAKDKRVKRIDVLLERPEFVDHWALKWADVLRNEEKQLDRKGVRAFHAWIRSQIQNDVPLNEFARRLIASRGSTYTEPASNYYRALRDTMTRAEATAQVFLGLRMQCAKCHNHPFNQWTQTDYHQFAAFFPQVQYKVLENNRRDKLDKHEFVGEQIVFMDSKGEHTHPVSGDALKPRFLGGTLAKTSKERDRLQALADWIADPTNPFFAKTTANRIWSHLFGRGLVDPNDDFRDSNPPAHPELLEALTAEFKAQGFRLKPLVRAIMTSRTYQASAMPNETNGDDETNLSHTLVRSLSAETLLDAIAQATEVSTTYDGWPVGTRAGQLASLPTPRRGTSMGSAEKFLKVFGKPERLLNCDCERSEATTLAQALQLITGEVLQNAISSSENRVARLLKVGTPDGPILEELYLATLNRYPSVSERESLLLRIASAPDRRAIWEDVLWALLNSKEFMLRK